MIKKVVFLISMPLYHRDYDRFGAKILIENGFNVVFFNFTPFLYPVLFEKGPKKNRYEGERQELFFSEKEALCEISKLKSDCFVVSFLHYRHSTFGIYRELSKVRVPYAISMISAIPTSTRDSSPIEGIVSRIRRIEISRVPTIIKNYLFRPEHARYMGIREPTLLLAGGKKSASHSRVSLSGEGTEILWGHTYDYDLYLKNKNENFQDHDGEDKAVFLDAPTPRFAHNSLVPRIKNYLTEERYYPSLCAFFDRLEKELKVKVEIASHPASEHGENPNYFGNRRVLRGKTCEQIMQSKIVINRDSTSMNFAVLAKKPVVFITSAEAEEHPENYLSSSIHAMASWLGKEPLNIDTNVSWNFEKEMLVDSAAYDFFKKSYIKYKGPEEQSLWQIVADRLKKI